jgi:hypothetical protein
MNIHLDHIKYQQLNWGARSVWRYQRGNHQMTCSLSVRYQRGNHQMTWSLSVRYQRGNHQMTCSLSVRYQRGNHQMTCSLSVRYQRGNHQMTCSLSVWKYPKLMSIHILKDFFLALYLLPFIITNFTYSSDLIIWNKIKIKISSLNRKQIKYKQWKRRFR